MTLLCATVMLGVMGIYRMLGAPAQRNGRMTEINSKIAFPGRVSTAIDMAFWG